jgi:truncated hemoglobin YjbI
MNYPLILEIINSFYDTVKKDVMIGYHFRFIEDFDEHIPRIADFWNLQLNGQLNNKAHIPFNLLSTHQALGIKKAEVGRWILLFNQNLQIYKDQNKITEEQITEWNIKIELFKKKIESII